MSAGLRWGRNSAPIFFALSLGACAPALPPPSGPDWAYIGQDAGGGLGHRAQCAGDVNGDGYDDLVASAPGADGTQGRVHLWYGSPQGLGQEPGWSARGEGKREVFGDRVGQAGDLNGDGYGDIFISAPGWNGGVGRVYVYHGGKRGLGKKAAWTYSPETAQEQFGDCTAPTGDVNGDGYDDLAVGAYGHDKARGRVLLFLGGPKGLGRQPVWQGRGDAQGDEYGYSLSTAGDTDGDGVGDLLIGAKYDDSGATDGGKAYLYRGGAKLWQGPAWTLAGEEEGGHLAYRLYGLGDLDGDGRGEVLVSEPHSDGRRGRVLLWKGRGSGLEPWLTLSGRDYGQWSFGQACGPLGDWDGDASPDYFVAGQSKALGELLVFDAQGRPIWRAQGEGRGDQFGAWAAPAGDLNGDGAPDLVVSATSWSPDPSQSGKLYVYLGVSLSAKRCSFQGYLSRKSIVK